MLLTEESLRLLLISFPTLQRINVAECSFIAHAPSPLNRATYELFSHVQVGLFDWRVGSGANALG